MSNYDRQWSLSTLITAAVLLCALATNLHAQIPSSPTNLQRTTLVQGIQYGGGFYYVSLTWDAAASAQSYNVYRALDTNPYTLHASGITDLFFDDNVGGCGNFNYYITAVNSFGESLSSTSVSGNPCDCPIFWVPWSDFETTRTSAHLYWNQDDVDGATGVVEIGLTTNDLQLVYYNTNYLSGHSHVATNLQPETLYWYRLTSYSREGNGNSFLGSLWTQPTNRPPVAFDSTAQLPEDWESYIELRATNGYATWEYYETLTYQIVTPPANGTLETYCPGCNWVKYTPAPNWSGTDSFTFIANDGEDDSSPATVAIIVDPINDSPVIEDRTLTTTEDTPATLILTGTDVEGQNLSFWYWWGSPPEPTNGTVQINGNQLTYTPFPNATGGDLIVYWAEDSAYGQSQMANITVTITPVNDAPVANSQSLSTPEDIALNVTLSGSDVEGDSLTFSIITVPANGVLSGTAPNLLYTPGANFDGTDQFTFRAADPSGATSTAVAAVNDAPLANPQSLSTPASNPCAITLTGSDVEGSALTYTVLTTPANGTLSGTAPNLTYTPAPGYSGPDSFTFKLNDGALDSSTATVNITVTAPTTTPAAPSGLVATPVSSSRIDVSWNDNSNNEDGFKIERSSNGNTFTQIGTVGPGVRNFSSTGLNANKTYYYRVRAYNVLGNSAYSNTASAKTLR